MAWPLGLLSGRVVVVDEDGKRLKAGGIGEHQLVGPGNLHLDINGVLFQPAHFQEWLISGIQD